MKISEIYELKCTDLNHKGLGVCKIDGFPIFVEGILINEVGEIKITKLTNKFGYGKLINLINASNDRVKPICPIFGICGGCDIMHLRYDAQLEYKRKSAIETLKRLGNIDYEIKNIVGMKDPYFYRNKVQIPFQMQNNKVVCGFYKTGTHEVIPFERCFIQPDISTKIAILIKDIANELKIPAYDEISHKGSIRHVLIRNTVNDEYMVVIITNGNNLINSKLIVERIRTNFPEVKSIIHNINNKKTNVILGEHSNLLYGSMTLKEELLGLQFKLSHKSFFQTNHTQTIKLYEKVLEYANPTINDVIVDGYCGVGTISLFLAQRAKQVYGIEIVEEAVEDAINNSKLNKIDNVQFIIGKTEEEILKMSDIKIDTIIVDPPRKGCEKILLDSIIKKEINKIVYVSCNIATLARDLEILNQYYTIKDITLYDMFPQTAHVETIVLLERRKDFY